VSCLATQRLTRPTETEIASRTFIRISSGQK
jgi:hypothetical protein